MINTVTMAPGQQIGSPTVSPQANSSPSPLPAMAISWSLKRPPRFKPPFAQHGNDVLAHQPSAAAVPAISDSNGRSCPHEDKTHPTFRRHRQHAGLKSRHLYRCCWWSASGAVDRSDKEDQVSSSVGATLLPFLLLPLPCMVPCYQGVCGRRTLTNTFFSLPDTECPLASRHQVPA